MKPLLLVGLVALAACAKQAPAKVEREFVCYTDGKLTERHVGVEGAYVSEDRVRINYTDGPPAFYWPEHGETCMVEELR